MLKTELTQEERRFAAHNHRLIHAYLMRRRLPEEEYYAIAAMGYLDAVHRYLSNAELQHHAFSTVATRAMRQSVSHAMRSRFGRRHHMPEVSLETGGRNGAPLWGISDGKSEQKLDEVLLLHTLSQTLTPQQCELARMRLAGYSVREIAGMKKLSEKRVRTQLRKAQNSFRQLRANT